MKLHVYRGTPLEMLSFKNTCFADIKMINIHIESNSANERSTGTA